MGSKLRVNSKVRRKCCGRRGMPLASVRPNKLLRVESQAWVGVLDRRRHVVDFSGGIPKTCH